MDGRLVRTGMMTLCHCGLEAAGQQHPGAHSIAQLLVTTNMPKANRSMCRRRWQFVRYDLSAVARLIRSGSVQTRHSLMAGMTMTQLTTFIKSPTILMAV
jgi:hypothetical protein